MAGVGQDKTFPVVEVFGPTLQGEGVDQGVVTHFVRFGGCDFRCDWCDTPHAVLPGEVRRAPRLASSEIVSQLNDLGPAPWVILSGGNPCLHDLSWLVEDLHAAGYKVAVETQGTRWQEWLKSVDRVCVSPKPPSSLQVYNLYEVTRFVRDLEIYRDLQHLDDDWLFVKVVVFDNQDLEWARENWVGKIDGPIYLSAGNDAGRTVGNPTREDTRNDLAVKRDLLEKSEWLTSMVLGDPRLHRVIVQSQYHVLLWGNKQGV